jgi:hypothetical protein
VRKEFSVSTLNRYNIYYYIQAEYATELGGAMLAPESLQAGAAIKMTGSVVIYEAESLEEAKGLVYTDVYYTNNVVSRDEDVELFRNKRGNYSGIERSL